MSANQMNVSIDQKPTGTSKKEPGSSLESQGSAGASSQSELPTESASKFAIYWFVLPLVVIIAAVILRMQCSAAG